MRTRGSSYAIAIDPGFASAGVAVVKLVPAGRMNEVVFVNVWTTEKSDKKRGVRAADDDFQRARLISGEMLEVFTRFVPVVVVSESKSPVRNASAAAKVAMMVGALACEVERRKLPYVQASPQDVRVALRLNKGASKDDVQLAVSQRLRGDLPKFFRGLASASTTAKKAEALARHPWDALAAFVACEDSDVIRALRPRV